MKTLLWLLVVGLFLTGCETIEGIAGKPGEAQYRAGDVALKPIPKLTSRFRGQRVAVFSFVNKALSQYPFLGNASSDFLIEFLLDAGFRTVEAKGAELEKIMAELKYSISDLVDEATAAKVGKHLGANLAFLGSVTDFNIVKKKGERGIEVWGWKVGGSEGSIIYSAQVAGRLVDVETREILAARTSSSSKEFNVAGGEVVTPWGRVSQAQEVAVVNETGGKILQHALNDMIIKIVERLNAL
jgi:curli biogenesis system outer membrane secretion channel CsgG